MDSRPVPIPRLPSKPRERPRRVKTYTGCWTCRRRRVKCDEARPTCRRCEAGNFTCEGYDIKLTWTNQPNPADASSDKSDSSLAASSAYSQRSSVRANNPRHTPTVAAEDIPSIMNDLDGARSGRSLRSRGPFSVFSINSAIPLERTPADYRLSIQNLVEAPLLPAADATARSPADPPLLRQLSEPTFIQYNPDRLEDEPPGPEMEVDEVNPAERLSTATNNPRLTRRARSSDYEEQTALGFRKE